jgi:signal transduction histidine kinase
MGAQAGSRKDTAPASHDEVVMNACTAATHPIPLGPVGLWPQRQSTGLPAAATAAPKAAMSRSASEVATMCHEVRNPLNAVLGFAQLLGADASLGERQRRHLQAIEQAARHILAIVEEAMAATRPHAQPGRSDDATVAVGPVIEEVVRWMEPAAAAAGVELSAPACDAVIRGDAHHLHEVLLNLVSNAVKYNHRGGTVIVRTVSEAANGSVRIDVQDTGQGIGVEAQPRLFKPFERLGAERSSVQGTGIGLCITQELVERMGGAIDVRSQAGAGSTFSISLRGAVPLASH